jgi:predicted kinase
MSNSKLTLVLMAGLKGAGKTTLTRALSQKLTWPYIDRDRFKEQLTEGAVKEEEARDIAYELALEAARMLIMRGGSVILDSSALYNPIIHKAQHIVQSAGDAQLKIILCSVDDDVRYERVRKKLGQDAIIRDNPAIRNEYLQYYKRLPSDRLELDTSQSLERCLAVAIDYLQS